MPVKQASVSKEKVEKPVQSVKTVESGSDTSSDTGVEEDSKTYLSASQNLLEQFFGMMKALASCGNFQNLVEQSAEKDSQALKDNLRQCAVLYGDIQAYLAQWESGKDTSVEAVVDETAVGEDVETVEENVVAETDVETSAVVDKGGDNENFFESFVGKICDKKDEADRHYIISALYQIVLNDDENFTRTEYIRLMVKDMGFEVVHKVPTKNLYQILYFTALNSIFTRKIKVTPANARGAFKPIWR